jgi:methylthioribose-1-phosphate isomerase
MNPVRRNIEKGVFYMLDTVRYSKELDAVVIIDQRMLPGREVLLELRTSQEIWEAINLLKVRGAPAIGVTTALAMAMLASRQEHESPEVFWDWFEKEKAYLASSRPTAVNLFWALDRMDKVCRKGLFTDHLCIEDVKDLLHREAAAIWQEDADTCKGIGEAGLTLLRPGDGILTHCNAGRLATVRYGTATAPIYLGQEKGYGFRVFADETRPLLQGARLTAYELMAAGVDVTLICDNMSGSVMAKGLVSAVLVGCDRVAANGDTANKIGTSMAALAAKRYGVPFYVCAPSSTIDWETKTGADIQIEERPPEEITSMWYRESMAPEGVKVFNPAFDITEHDLISAFVTEYGIVRPPFDTGLAMIRTRVDQTL